MPSPSAAPSGTDQPAQRPRDNGSNNATSAQFLYYTLALIAIIASVCLVSLCYRSVYFSSIFKCNKPRERNVEVIIETNAEFEPEPNYVDADSCTPQNGDVIPSEITNSQKVFLENAHYVQDTESGWSQPEQTPVAVVACGRECSAGNVLARMIGVMVNVPAVSVVENRSNLRMFFPCFYFSCFYWHKSCTASVVADVYLSSCFSASLHYLLWNGLPFFLQQCQVSSCQLIVENPHLLYTTIFVLLSLNWMSKINAYIYHHYHLFLSLYIFHLGRIRQ